MFFVTEAFFLVASFGTGSNYALPPHNFKPVVEAFLVIITHPGVSQWMADIKGTRTKLKEKFSTKNSQNSIPKDISQLQCYICHISFV